MIPRVLIAILFLSIMAALSLWATIESARIVQGTDSTQVSTVGLISMRGWPWTYEATAPGFAWAQEINARNFEYDVAFYYVAGSSLLGLPYLMLRRSKQQPT